MRLTCVVTLPLECSGLTHHQVIAAVAVAVAVVLLQLLVVLLQVALELDLLAQLYSIAE